MYQKTTATRKILKLSKRIRALQGGTSASKTVSILLVLIDKAQRDTTGTLTSIVSESLPHLKRGVIRDFKSIMKSHNYWKQNNWNATDKIYTFETGSQIEFFGADDHAKLRGARRDRLYVNEANNIPFYAFEELEVRTKEYVFLDWNPTNEFWFYTELLPNRTDVEHIILTYKDNEALDQEIVKSIEARKVRKAWWQVYGLGQLGEIESRVYTGWQIIDEIPHEARLERYGLDFGYTNDPTAIVAVYSYNGGVILDEVLYQTGMRNKQIADVLKNHSQALVIADSSEPKSIDEIRLSGVNIIGADKGSGSVAKGIDAVQDARVSVTKKSVNIIKEYRNYLFVTDKNGRVLNEPEDYNNHAMDAIRYAVNGLKPRSREEEAVRARRVLNARSRNGINNAR